MNSFENALSDQKDIILILAEQTQKIVNISNRIVERLRNGGKIFWVGNGGSAVDCQHFSAELVGRYLKDREPIASIALTSDNAIITALSNDISYNFIFDRQINALANSKDILIAITTSGKSENIINALKTAMSKEMYTVLITGLIGNKSIGNIASDCISIPTNSTPRIQESYFIICHALCDYIESEMERR